MLPANNNVGGTNIGFPDVCLTPTPAGPVPIPYPNFAFNMMSFPFCFIVKVLMAAGMNMLSSPMMSTGDEGGVAHPMIKGPSRYTMGSPKVFLEKLPGISFACPTTSNNFNDPIGIVAIPSVTNVLFSLRGEESKLEQAELSAVDHASLLARTRDGEDVERELLEDGVGYVRLNHFGLATPTRLHRAIEALARTNPLRGLVIDLRGNPGGEVDAMLEIADDFLPIDTPIVTLRGPDGELDERRARHLQQRDVPLAVLIDEGTASAAEQLAAALQRAGRAQLFGSPSYGKHSAQRIVPIAGPTGTKMLYATVAEVDELRDGVVPDVPTAHPLQAARERLA